jgi:2-polyprenyl-3-methyl-5-hydroxy-6-metoxy-1,4-benzoquinol methylase
MAIDESKLNAFMGAFVHDFGATMHAATIVIGDQLGLYKVLAGTPATAEALAAKTGTDARYVREWLSAQAASNYVDFDPETQCFSLNEIQAFALAEEGSPAFIPGAFQIAVAQFTAISKIVEAFRSGKGVGWHEHDAALFHGTERFFRPGYSAHLVDSWLPSLSGVTARLEGGARVADVGCGHGASTMIMARAFAASRFVGFDYHAPSIMYARKSSEAAGLGERLRFDVAQAKDFPGGNYDLVTVFDCLHDMGDPVGAAVHIRESLKPGGTWMIVEPFAHDHLEENLNPVGRVFYSASTCICTPASRAQEVGLCLGAQAGEQLIRRIVMEGGFKKFRRACETPFNLVYEARA